MGSSDPDTPTKAKKVSPAPGAAAGHTQEQPPAGSLGTAPPAVYPDWSGFQAYPAMPPHGFFQHSPQAHPYMWGPQHLIPPYGTPPSPYVMYPPGVYAHPSIPPGSHPFSPYATAPSPNGTAEASGAVASGMEVDGKSSNGKEKSSIKRSKESLGSLNMITRKGNNDVGKTSGASANGMSQSSESGSECSSEGSDDNSQNVSRFLSESQPKTHGALDSCDETTQNGAIVVAHPSTQEVLNDMMPVPVAGIPAGVAGPTTALNIGMDYWAATNPSIPSVRGKVPSNAMAGARETVPSDLWLQDERELKRQRRKQSNRESARRSRLRKQAECEELAQRVEVLKEENAALRAEVDRVRHEYDQLLAQNTSLKERLEGPSGGTDDDRHERDGSHQTLDPNTGHQNGL